MGWSTSNINEVSNKSIHAGPMNISSIPASGEDESFLNYTDNLFQTDIKEVKQDERLEFLSVVTSPKFGDFDTP